MNEVGKYPDGFEIIQDGNGFGIQHVNYTVVVGRGASFAAAFSDWERQVEIAQTWVGYSADIQEQELAAMPVAAFYIPREAWIAEFGNGIARAFARNEVNPCHPAIRQFIERQFSPYAAPTDAGEWLGRKTYLGAWQVRFGENSVSIKRDVVQEDAVSAAWRHLRENRDGGA